MAGKVRPNAGSNAAAALLTLSLLLVAGCTPAPKSLQQSFKSNTESVAVMTVQRDGELQILDHTGLYESTETQAQYGLGPALLGEALLASKVSSEKRLSLGGDPARLRPLVQGLPIDSELHESIKARLSKRYEVSDYAPNTGQKPSSSNHQWLQAYKAKGIDALIRVSYLYGLATYVGEHASAAIDAEVEIWDVKTGKRLSRESISSDKLHKEPHTVPEFAADHGRLFRDQLLAAADSIALQIAARFNIDEREASTSTVSDEVSSGCSYPFPLTRDFAECSGAQRLVVIDGRKIDIAGSDDGKTVMISSADKFENAMQEILTLRMSSALNRANAACLETVKHFLAEQKIGLLRTVKIVHPQTRDVYGYILVLNRDGYSALKRHTVGEVPKTKPGANSAFAPGTPKPEIHRGFTLKLAYKPGSEAAATMQPVIVLPFADMRAEQANIGYRTAAFGVDMGKVYADRPVAEYVRNAFVEEMAAKGYGDSSAEGVLTISGEVNRFWVQTNTTPLYWDIEATVQVRLATTCPGSDTLAESRSYEVIKTTRTYAWPSESLIEKLFQQATAELTQQAASDSAKTITTCSPLPN